MIFIVVSIPILPTIIAFVVPIAPVAPIVVVAVIRVRVGIAIPIPVSPLTIPEPSSSVESVPFPPRRFLSYIFPPV